VTENNIEAALSSASQGFASFPTVPNLKVPYAGSSGYKDGTLEEAEIRELWDRHPDGVPAIACGLSDPRLIVLDVDGLEGMRSLDKLVDKYGPVPVTRTVRTPSGGWHFYFLRPTDHKPIVSSSQSVIGTCLDIKADDGYVVAYPYDGDEPITEIPEWLFALITNTERQVLGLDFSLQEPELVEIGQRHDWLYTKACDLYPSLGKAMRLELQRLNRRLRQPKPDAEVDAIADHVIENHIPKNLPGLPWMEMDWREVQMIPQLVAMTDRQLGLWIRLRAIAWGSTPQGTIPADHKLLAKMLRQDYTEGFENEDLPLILFEYRLDPHNGYYVNATMRAYLERKKSARQACGEGGRKARANDAKKFVPRKITTERKGKVLA